MDRVRFKEHQKYLKRENLPYFHQHLRSGKLSCDKHFTKPIYSTIYFMSLPLQRE